MLQIKVFESDSLSELVEEANQFLQELDERDVVDIKYQTSMCLTSEDVLESYSVMILYGVRPLPKKSQTGYGG